MGQDTTGKNISESNQPVLPPRVLNRHYNGTAPLGYSFICCGLRKGRSNFCVFSLAESNICLREFEEAALVIHNHIKTPLQHPDPVMLLHDLVKSKAVSGLTVMKCLGLDDLT